MKGSTVKSASRVIRLAPCKELATDPPIGTDLERDAPVDLVLSAGRPQVPVPNVTGGTVDESLRSSRSATASVGVRRMRRVLVAAQFAIATPLLIVAGLLLVSLNQLRAVDLGVESERVLTGSIRLPSAQYQDPARTNAFWDELERRVAALPGISSVAYSDGLPPSQPGQHNNFALESQPPDAPQAVTPWVAVSPKFVGTMGLRLIEGRLLDDRDIADQNLRSIVVDRAWARRFFPNESAVGKRLKSGGCTECEWTTVVGVVSDVKFDGMEQANQGTVYFPINASTSRFLIVRSSGDPRALVLRQLSLQLDAGRGQLQPPLAPVGRARLVRDISFAQQLAKDAAQALLGDAKNRQ